jgi:hypothetical protein
VPRYSLSKYTSAPDGVEVTWIDPVFSGIVEVQPQIKIKKIRRHIVVVFSIDYTLELYINIHILFKYFQSPFQASSRSLTV